MNLEQGGRFLQIEGRHGVNFQEHAQPAVVSSDSQTKPTDPVARYSSRTAKATALPRNSGGNARLCVGTTIRKDAQNRRAFRSRSSANPLARYLPRYRTSASGAA